MLKLTAFIVFVFCALTCFAQPARQFTFTHYSTENGLLSNQVNSIAQDPVGYMWIATNDGLIRYDGSRYRNFRHIQGDTLSLPVNQVLQLLYDSRKNLWVLLSNGKAGIFNTAKFTFHEASVDPEHAPSLKIPNKKLITDEYGNVLLLLAGHELLSYNAQSNRFAKAFNFIKFPSDWKINDIIQQPATQKYWLALSNAGLAVYDAATATLSTQQNNSAKEELLEQFPTIKNASEFMFDKSGRLWFSTIDTTYSYVYCYDFKNKKPVLDKLDFISTFGSYYEVNGFFQQKSGMVWLRGYKTLGYYNEKEKNFKLIPASPDESGIDYRYINCIYEDRENTLWIGTGNNGFFCVNPSMDFFTNVKHIDRMTGKEGYGSLLSFIADKDGSLLAGTWPDGMYRYDNNFNSLPLGIKGIAEKNKVGAFSMFPSPDSPVIWISSHPGFYAYDQRNRGVKFYDHPMLGGQQVRQIAEDKHRNLWLGMRALGVIKWDAGKGRKKFEDGFTKFDKIPPQQISNITIDSKGLVWVAGMVSGVFVIDPATDSIVMRFAVNAEPPFQLPEEGATAIYEYDDSTVMIATPHHILRFNRKQKKLNSLTSDDTIYGTISSIEKDDQNNLWVGTTSALYRVNPKTRVFISFNRNDGIGSDYFILSSSYVLEDGRMIFGASNRFIAFDPSVVDVSTAFPDITITDVRVMNSSLPVDSVMNLRELELDYVSNSLTVEFSTLSYSSAYVIEYIMEGLDKDWKIADDSRQAVYSYLKPGSYKLKFRTIDAEGVIKESSSVLSIWINAPFYQTWWFYSLVGLSVVIVLYWIDRQRIQRIRNEQNMRIALATNLHQDVNTTLRNINVLSEIAAMKSVHQPEQSREYIKEIQYKSRSMVVAMDDVLWSINPDNDNMAKTIDRFRQITESVAGKHNTKVVFEQGENIGNLKPDMKTRMDTVIIFKLMLLVLIEELQAHTVTVQLDCVKSSLQLKAFSEELGIVSKSNTAIKYIDEINARAASLNAFVDVEIGSKGAWFLLEIRI